MKRKVQNFGQFPGSSGNKRKNLGFKIDHVNGEHRKIRFGIIYSLVKIKTGAPDLKLDQKLINSEHVIVERVVSPFYSYILKHHT